MNSPKGSARKADHRVRINVKQIDAVETLLIGQERFDAAPHDIAALQDSASQSRHSAGLAYAAMD